MILTWEKPKQVMSKEAWKSIEADSCVPGTYTPNMSKADQLAWKAKFRSKLGQVEIRRDGLVIVVSLDGYRYKTFDTGVHARGRWGKKAPRIHIASNNAQQFSFADWGRMVEAVDEAKRLLLAFKDDPKKVKDAIKQGDAGVEALLTEEAA
jgi:hypothetical protein